MDYKPKPTVLPHSGFVAADDGNALRSAMKGFGTDEDEIIEILTTRSNQQRQMMRKYFTDQLGRDLIDDLKSELGGTFEDVIVGLMLTPEEYLCKQLNQAMDGVGTEERTLVEIICTKTNEEMKRLVDVYGNMYGRPLTEHMCGETSGHFRRLLTMITTGTRNPVGSIDAAEAKKQAEDLYAAGEGKLGTDEEVFNRILANDSFDQLRLVFEEYKELSGMTIEQALKHEMDGELLEAMSAIVECVQSQAAFFATRLHKAMDGAGTDDPTLIRIVISRSEIDLENIKDEFERIYDRTLLSAIESEISGDYKKAICALIR